jgi:hypothetical protein
MKTLEPIGLSTQIEDVLSGIVRDISDKKKEIKNNIDKVKKINGKKVYNVIIDGDYLRYNLKKRNDGELVYYYPVQYANIEFE